MRFDVMRRGRVFGYWRTVARWGCGLLFLWVGCRGEGVVLPTVQPTAVSITLPTATVTAVSPTATPLPQPTATLPPTATPSPTATSTPDPYQPYTIAALAARSYGGGELEIVETLEETASFTRYLIRYPSDGLTIYGFMNVPHEGVAFPLVVLLHGYVDPAVYQTLAYTRRYADALAEAGFFVIHPNLRGFPPSDGGDDYFRVGLAVDVLNLLAIVREQSQDVAGALRRVDADDVYLWGHSMGGGVALRVAVVNPADYLRGVVVYGGMSGNERWNYERIVVWSEGRSGAFELAAGEEVLTAVSPIYHLNRLHAPISIHHSDADEVVPHAWAVDLCERLTALAHPVDCYTYPAQPHTFNGEQDRLFRERVARFFSNP